MTRRFVAKNRKYKSIKAILWLLIVILSFWIFISILFKNKLDNSILASKLSNNAIKLGLNIGESHEFNLLNPKDIFNLSLNYKLDSEVIYNSEFLEVDEKNVVKPRIYIYNSHDTEGYDSSILNAYNISYTVKVASLILKEYLSDYGIESFVETESMEEYLNNQGLDYGYSYQASRYYIDKRREEYPSLELFIDIHRDSPPKYATTAYYNDLAYAKVIFIMGVGYDGAEENIAMAEYLNAKLPAEITRGVSLGNGYGVIGAFNQDIGAKSMLIEIGGIDNTIDEINNTCKLLASAIFDYMNGE